MPKTLAEKIADYGGRLKLSTIPHEAVHEAKKRLIDSIACILGGLSSPPARAAVLVSPAVKEGPVASIVGEHRTAPEAAAFANGVMVRYLDFNDTYLSKEPAHPSDNIPAALAAAEAAGRSGGDLITAIVAAYEVQCRLCDAASLRAKGWDHVAYGAFSSTLAASMLLGLTKDETIHALGIAGVTSPALRQTRAGELSMWKGCAFAEKARGALFASMLAKNGVSGPSPIFEGEFGFFRLLTGPFEVADFASDTAGHFKILDTCIKYYPVEYHAQSAVGAAIELYDEIEDTEEIESIKVHTFRAAYEIISGAGKWRPATRESADHSLPFCVAAALRYGDVKLSTFTEKLSDRGILALADRLTVTVDKELDALYPEAIPNRVEVRLKSGRMLSKEMIYPKGHPMNPMTDREVEEKLNKLGGWYFTDRGLAVFVDTVWRLEDVGDVRDFMRLLART